MKQFVLLLLFFIVLMNAQSCDTYTDDMNKCIQSTPNSFCIYDKIFGTCKEINSPQIGCNIYLNSKACLGQEEELCQFINSKCRPVGTYVIQQALCESRKFNKLACLSLQARICTWNNNTCKNINSGAVEPTQDFESWKCENSWPGLEVSPKACSTIQNAACKHVVTNSRSICQNVWKDEANSLYCTTTGLSRLGCVMVTREDQYCIYDEKNLVCKDILYGDIEIHCNLFINKNACLKADNCVWKQGGCTIMAQEEVLPESTQVSSSVCSQSNSLFRFDTLLKSCVEVKEEEVELPCNTPGLSLLGCMQQKQNCIFQNGQCREVTNFNGILCQGSGQLNQSSCLKVKTSGQYCHWNGKNCQNIGLNQSLKCEDQVQVNSNVCSNIVSEPCKYDSKTNSCKLPCIEGISCKQDGCNTEGLNLIGCAYILSPNETCQWQNQQCNFINIPLRSFKCQEMTHVNCNVCSKFLPAPDNPDIYCGFNKKLMGCQVLSPESLQTLLCGVPSLGLNNEACSAIRTPGQVCHFWHGTCISYAYDQSISMPCNWLKYANPATCARNVYQAEICVYNAINKGCTTHVAPTDEQCDQEGINIYGCQIKPLIKCFFSRATFKCSDIQDSYLETLKCDDGLGKEVCLKIITTNEKCAFDSTLGQCVPLIFNEEKVCIDNAFLYVNANVCAAIFHKDVQEEYSVSGYCVFDQSESRCTAIKDMNFVCPNDDRCCTNVLGFNISSCSRFSRGICYFQDQKCQQFNAHQNYEIIMIQNYFDKQKFSCYKANYELCGKINWNDPDSDTYNMCYQPSQNSVCKELKETMFVELQNTNISIFFESTTRANMWICKRLDKIGLHVQYNSNLGNCATITSDINCSTPNINKNACISMTAFDYCIWDKPSLTCSQVLSADLENLPCTAQLNQKACLAKGLQCQFNKTTQECEPITLLTTVNCNGLPSNLTYNYQVCSQIVTVGQSCIYDSVKKTCDNNQLQQQQCDGVGFNEYSCTVHTFSNCKWDNTNKKCVQFDFEEVKLTIGCEDNINKATCLKVQKEGCKWEDSTKKCKKLEKDNNRECSSLFGTNDLYNERACLEITKDGNICVYDELRNQCYNTLCAEGTCTGIQIGLKESCTFRRGNVHYCLIRTKGFYCQYDSITYTCSEYTGPKSGLVCATPNINRNVCMKYTKEVCRFNLQTSQCEKDSSTEFTPCSKKKADQAYLYNQQSCIMVSQDVKTDDKKTAREYCNTKKVCTVERYCFYSEEDQGCDVMDFIDQEKRDGSNCVPVLKQLTDCKDICSRALCLEKIEAACRWDLLSGMCLNFDESSPKVTDCSLLSALACTSQNDIACFVDRVEQIPTQCDTPEKYYLVCKPLSLAPSYIQQGIFTYTPQQIEYYSNWKKEYFTLDDTVTSGTLTRVSPRVCSQITSGLGIYAFSTMTCVSASKSTICDQSGLTYQACDTSSKICEYDSTAKMCVEKIKSEVINPDTFYKLFDLFLANSQYQSYSQLSSNQTQCVSNQYVWLSNDNNALKAQIGQSTCTNCINQAESLYSEWKSNCTKNQTRDEANCQTKLTPACPSNPPSNCCDRCCEGDCITCENEKVADYNICNSAANTNHTAELKICYDKLECHSKYFDCVKISSDQCDFLSSYYLMMPYKSCISSLTSPCQYISTNYNCQKLTIKPSDCSVIYNKQACLHYSTGICKWSSNRCSTLAYFEYNRIKDCSSVSYNACPHLTKTSCELNGDTCQAAGLSVHCDSMVSANAYACSSTTKEPCYFDTSCRTYYPTNPSVTLNCDTTGINKIGCLSYTVGYCQYLKFQCQSISIFDNVSCQNVNKDACSKLTSQPCMWDAETDPLNPTCKPITYLTENQTCTNYSVIPQNLNNLVNSQTCSGINKTSTQINCYYNGSNCQITETEVPCLQEGINQNTCLNKTNEYCIYQDRCLPTNDRNKYCSESINLKLCLDLLNQPCYFLNGRCKTFDYQSITDIATAKQQINLEGVKYNPTICSQINLPGLSLRYNSTTKKCEEITGVIPDLKCNTDYINQQTCLSYTTEICQLINGECESIGEEILNLKDTLCSELYNWKACISIPNQKCYFKDGLCRSANSDLKCSNQSLVTRLICQTVTDVACSFNSITSQCEVQTNNQLQCTQDGLNKIGCLNYTNNKNCLFKNNQCQNGLSDQFDCNDDINKQNCGTVVKSTCFFENSCQFLTEEILQTGKFNRCLNGFVVSMKVCTHVTDHGCKYDPSTSLCTLATGLENCLNDQSLNQIGCQQNRTTSKCFWKNNQCMEPTVSELSTLKCSDSVNLGTCLSITTPGEQCQFINNSCQPVILAEITASCASIVNINSYEICERVISGSCIYTQNKCEILTTQLATCQRGVNHLACLSMIAENCSFNSFCDSKSIIQQCSQVSTQTECLKLNLQCQWLEGSCVSMTERIQCSNLPELVTYSVCDLGITANLDIICMYDPVQYKCFEKLPQFCVDLQQRATCVKQINMPCVWLGTVCNEEIPKIELNDCLDYETDSSIKVCRMVHKKGQLCEYREEKCRVALYEQVNWEENVNQNGCLEQKIKACYWVESTLSCICPDTLETYVQENTCSSNQSYLLCTSITKQLSFCQWNDGVCTSLPEEYISNESVNHDLNVNACILMRYADERTLIYDSITKSCIWPANLKGTCEQPGLNSYGCIYQEIAPCSFSLGIGCFDGSKLSFMESEQTNVIPTISYGVCMNQPIPKYYKNRQCLDVTKETKCSDKVNQAGCLLIQSEGCIFENNQCYSFKPVETCAELENNQNIQINKIVCSMVDIDQCVYKNGHCSTVIDYTTCNQEGLNYLACIQIKGCIFDTKTLTCKEFSSSSPCPINVLANPYACAKATTSCSYDYANQMCIGIQTKIQCASIGLSQQGCVDMGKCLWIDNKCDCKIYYEHFPKCQQITNQDECEHYSTCKFYDGVCTSMQCKFLRVPENGTKKDKQAACTQMPNCYLKTQYQCSSTPNCESIEFNQNLYDDCSDISINNQPCKGNQQQCATLNCSDLQQGECTQFSKYCHWDPKEFCTKKDVRYYTEEECGPNSNIKNKSMYFVKGICKDFQSCSEATGFEMAEAICNQIQAPNQCGYIQSNINEKGQCTPIPCRALGKTKSQCDGKHINNRSVCYLKANNCLSCEETKNYCDCLEQKYCSWENEQCISLNCNSLNSEECSQRSDCYLENENCLVKCKYHYSEYSCQQNSCQWNDQTNQCTDCLLNQNDYCTKIDSDKCKSEKCCTNRNGCKIDCNKLEPNQCQRPQCILTLQKECLNPINGMEKPTIISGGTIISNGTQNISGGIQNTTINVAFQILLDCLVIMLMVN